MALIIEDGSAKTNSQSYVTVAEFDAFLLARNITLDATPEEKEALLIEAMDYMRGLPWIGYRKTSAQAQPWPRTSAYMYGELLPDDAIPDQLKLAQLQLGVDADTVDLMPNILPGAGGKGPVIEERVEGAVAVKYAAPVQSITIQESIYTAGGAMLSRAYVLLKPLLRSGGAMGQTLVHRG